MGESDIRQENGHPRIGEAKADHRKLSSSISELRKQIGEKEEKEKQEMEASKRIRVRGKSTNGGKAEDRETKRVCAR